ncbi:hypothetical protein AB8880_04555 [Alphaproteobacteria bacterium LSUCC0684]
MLKDLMDDGRSWYLIGEIWYEWAPTSLQVSESIISRYIDPCGLLVSLNCEPFLWHPFISSILVLPAAPSFIITSLLLILAHRWFKRKRSV